MFPFRLFKRPTTGHGDALAHPARLAEWLDGLPLLDPARSVTEILGPLRSLRAAELDDPRRQALLDTYRAKTNQLFEAYDSPSFHQRTHTEQRRVQIRNEVGQLAYELARGYKRLAQAGHRAGLRVDVDERFRRAIYCAMEQTIYLLLHAFRTYGPVPRKAHHDLHQLYRLAESHRALYRPVPAQEGDDQAANVGRLYKQFLLLSITDPFHLGKGEAVTVFRLLERYGGAAELGRSDPPCEGREGLFVVDLASDGPPIPCRRAHPESRPEDLRTLKVRQVITAALRDQVNEGVSPEHRLYADQGRRLVQRLIPRLQGQSHRREQRQPANWAAGVAVGIEAIYRYYRDGGLPDAEESGLGGYGIEVETVDESGRPTQPAPLHWLVVEESAQGYRLECRCRTAAARVGEVIGVVDQSDPRRTPEPRLGLVRWLRCGHDGHTLIGAERLDALGVAVHCRPDTHAFPAPAPTACLLLPGSRERREPAVLLAPRGALDDGQLLRLTRGQKVLRLRTGAAALETACLRGHTFRAVPTEDGPGPATTP